MTQFRNQLLKLIGFIIGIVCSLSAQGQVDLKNALPDLLSSYAKSGHTVAAAKTALAISNFYLRNKSYGLYLDSTLFYAEAAGNLSSKLGYTKGSEDANVLIANALIFQQKNIAVQNMINHASGALYCRLYIARGIYELDHSAKEKSGLQRAATYFYTAQRYAEQNHMPRLAIMALINGYRVMQEKGLPGDSIETKFRHLISLCRVRHDISLEACAWLVKASYQVNGKWDQANYIRVRKLATASGLTELRIWALKNLADDNLQEGRLDLADTQLLQVIKEYKLAGFKNLQYTYNLLTAIALNKGKLEKAMRYGLLTIDCAHATGTNISLDVLQVSMAAVCDALKQDKESLEWYQKSLETVAHDPHYNYAIFRIVMLDEIARGKARQVLQKLGVLEKIHPVDDNNYIHVNLLKAECYIALKQPAAAARYYQDMIKWADKLESKDLMYYTAYKLASTFYLKQKDYATADIYLSKLFTAPANILPSTYLASMYQQKFAVDSSRGKYLSAIKQFEAAKAITDSLFDQARVKQGDELQAHYKSSEKEHENLVLRNRNTLQKSELDKEGLKRKLTTTGLGASVLLIGILFFFYRIKQRANQELKNRQEKIEQQNFKLNQLLAEKEWLVKEVHHRVKNSLQIVSSLLNTQSKHLENEEARAAIRDSQNRMQAISIVHHKLYQSDDLASIEFKLYIQELVESICASFHADSSIRFTFDIIDVILNTEQTVPIGLMLNEAITNSVKYAFTDTAQPHMTISLSAYPDDHYKLTIADNGKGLPSDFDLAKCNTLGINLMMGLAVQINGKLMIQEDNGTLVTIIFPRQPDQS